MSENEVVIKVTASKEHGYSKRIASAICWQLRDFGYCKIRAVKETAVNHAIKAVAICNERVKPANVVLGLNICFSNALDGGDSVVLDMTARDVADIQKPPKSISYKVSGREDDPQLNARLSDAISMQGIENIVALKCIGQSAVYRGTIASVMAKGLVYSKGYSSVIVPEWETFTSNDGNKTSLINLNFWAFKDSDSI